MKGLVLLMKTPGCTRVAHDSNGFLTILGLQYNGSVFDPSRVPQHSLSRNGFCFFPADMVFTAYRYRVLVVYAATILVRGRVNAQDVSGDGSDDAGKLAVHWAVDSCRVLKASEGVCWGKKGEDEST
jgi:hypothetical protein